VEVDDAVNFIETYRKKFPKLIIQFVEAKYVLDREHLWAIIRQAWISKKRRLSRVKLDIEMLQRLACDSRVSTSLKSVGLKKGILDIIAISIGEKNELQSLFDSLKKKFKTSKYLLEKNVEKENFLKKYHRIENNTLNSILVENDELGSALIEKAVLILAER
jgi:tRNA threonylcarbamoyladenosine modification (KEOPS) complex Cgi121 subunit